MKTTTKTTTKTSKARKVTTVMALTILAAGLLTTTAFGIMNGFKTKNSTQLMTSVSAQSMDEPIVHTNIVDTTPDEISDEHNRICYSINSQAINYYDVLSATKGTHTVIVNVTGDVGTRLYNGRNYNESVRGIKVNGLKNISSTTWDKIYAALKQDFDNCDVSIVEGIPSASEMYQSGNISSVPNELSLQGILGVQGELTKEEMHMLSNVEFEIIK